MNAQLATAAQITRQYGPWVSLATSALIVIANLKK